MRLTPCLMALFLAFASLPCQAEKPTKAVEENITRTLGAFIDDVEITRISPTAIDNLYEVVLGADVLYMSGDGRFVFRGDMLDLQERRNLSEEQRTLTRKGILNNLPTKEYIEFAPAETEHVIYVFTDVDCGYCRRLHRDVPELNKNGIAVRYLAFPRGGEGSHAYKVMQSVWCSEDRKQALTDAKNGKPVPPRKCPNPVDKHYLLGQQFGVRGTPAIYLEDGKDLPGYMPPETLLKVVEK